VVHRWQGCLIAAVLCAASAGCTPIQWDDRCEILEIHNATAHPVVVSQGRQNRDPQRIGPGEQLRSHVCVRVKEPPEVVRVAREGSFQSQKIEIAPRWPYPDVASKHVRRFRVAASGSGLAVIEETTANDQQTGE
jgi:hypothetical protein